jgi:hypothetical protein
MDAEETELTALLAGRADEVYTASSTIVQPQPRRLRLRPQIAARIV